MFVQAKSPTDVHGRVANGDSLAAMNLPDISENTRERNLLNAHNVKGKLTSLC